MNQFRIIMLVLLILVPASMRLGNLPWNLAPIGAVSLFCGAYFRRRWLAIAVPLVAMFLSDLVLGLARRNVGTYTFHELMPLVYACYVLYVCLGFGVRRRWEAAHDLSHHDASQGGSTGDEGSHSSQTSGVRYWFPVGMATLTGSIVFFVVTNFADWLMYYPHTGDELVKCYLAAIPFFRNTLASDVFGVAVLFGGYEFLQRRAGVLAAPEVLGLRR